MRTALIAAAALLVAVAAVYVLTLPEGEAPAPGTAAPAPDAPPPGSEEEVALLLGDILPVGPGETAEGVTIRREGERAVFELPEGVTMTLTPAGDHALGERYVVLGPRSGGFFLEGPEGGRVYISYAHAGRPMEPPEDRAEEQYEMVAERISEAGELPFLDGTVEVASVTPRADGVYYCLARSDGMRFQGATRFVGAISVTAMRAGACPEDRALVARRLDLGAEAVAANR